MHKLSVLVLMLGRQLRNTLSLNNKREEKIIPKQTVNFNCI